MSGQDGTQLATLQKPTSDEIDAWLKYWDAQGLVWRKEPEIDAERQKYLAERRSITSDDYRGISGFSGIRLGRADVEWLLATRENGLGPVNWSDESQCNRKGLDLRGLICREQIWNFYL